jgi:glyoxylase-like metal-dependent hydrolase (beta-lactamase superfamily II)
MYFRQLLSGRDFGQGNLVAHQFVNFAYLLGDRATGEAVIVDPAHDVQSLLAQLDADGMRLVGVLATHHHADHVGGELVPGLSISGVADLLEEFAVPVHIHEDERTLMEATSGVGSSDLRVHAHGDVLHVGAISIDVIHTPGHTPGSACFHTDSRLLTGDTLFADGCGHTEMPGGDPRAFYRSLHQRLAPLPDDTTIFPGHLRVTLASMTLGRNRRTNFVFDPRSEAEWMDLFGPGGCDGTRPMSLVSGRTLGFEDTED